MCRRGGNAGRHGQPALTSAEALSTPSCSPPGARLDLQDEPHHHRLDDEEGGHQPTHGEHGLEPVHLEATALVAVDQRAGEADDADRDPDDARRADSEEPTGEALGLVHRTDPVRGGDAHEGAAEDEQAGGHGAVDVTVVDVREHHAGETDDERDERHHSEARDGSVVLVGVGGVRLGDTDGLHRVGALVERGLRHGPLLG